ncbi:MAG: TolB family protein [Dehalococcoidia bacterium]
MQLRGVHRWRPGPHLGAPPPLSHATPERQSSGVLAGRTTIAIPNWLVFGTISLAAVAVLIVAGVSARPLLRAARSRLDTASTSATVQSIDMPGSLMYTVTLDDRSFVQATRADGAAPRSRPLATGSDLFGDAVSSPGPDGTQIAYLHAGCPRCTAVYELRDLTSGAVREIGSSPLTPPLAGAPTGLAWSGDGARIAFVEQGLDAPQPRLFVFDQVTNERRALAPADPEPQAEPTWSPDGSMVAYLAGGPASVVTAVDVQSGVVRRLNDQLPGAAGLAWSPDGRYLSVLQAGQVWLVDTTDGHGFQLQAPGSAVRFAGWAPGSRSLLVITDESFGGIQNRSLVTVPVDGGSPQRLAVAATVDSARWSADGRYIAWATADAHRWSVWMAPSNGGSTRRLASGTGSVTLDDWR